MGKNIFLNDSDADLSECGVAEISHVVDFYWLKFDDFSQLFPPKWILIGHNYVAALHSRPLIGQVVG